MDRTFILVSGDFILGEFQSIETAVECRDVMRQGYPEQAFELVFNG
ncbi:MAG: hypothetical protein WCL71_16270 [Deltaproteobacteria bacterium]